MVARQHKDRKPVINDTSRLLFMEPDPNAGLSSTITEQA
jgi:hypothetical protein